MKTIPIPIIASVVALACSDPAPAQPPVRGGEQGAIAPLPGPDAARCEELMAEMRALRDGPQPCEGPDDCWVFHNGEHWDGCPVEVNKTNNAILEKMRAEIDGLGCPVDKGAMCAAQEVKFCVAGGCGGKSPIAPVVSQ